MAKKTGAENQANEKPKAPKLNRAQAADRVVVEINGPTTLGELAAKADALMVEAGADSKPKTMAVAVKRSLETAAQLGVVKLTKPTDILVERLK